MEEDYCPIKYRNKCKATGEECDHIGCAERIRKIGTNKMGKKYEEWAGHRRGEVRWRDK